MSDVARVITLDIETLPSQKPGAAEEAKARVKVPSNYSKPETIAKYIEENAEEAYRRTALDGGYGELLMVGTATDDAQPVVMKRGDLTSPDAERALLEVAFSALSAAAGPGTTWIGHNIAFDLKFLYQRAIIHQVALPAAFPVHPKPWDDRIFDTSYMWTGDHNRGIKLNELATILDIDSHKDDFDGSMVWDAVQAGQVDMVAEYCAADVHLTRAIAARMGLGVTNWP